jgi:hypothetical protein
LKRIHAEKQSRKAILELLQEGAEKMLNEIDTAKGHIGKMSLETEELLKEHITAQIVESIAEKSIHINT